jgi:hypothetical protein
MEIYKKETRDTHAGDRGGTKDEMAREDLNVRLKHIEGSKSFCRCVDLSLPLLIFTMIPVKQRS